MAKSSILFLCVVCALTGLVTSDRLQPGETKQFDYSGDRYWVKIDWWGSVTYQNAVDDCKNLHDAEVTTITDDAQYQEIQTEVEDAIPGYWNEVMLWTADSESPGTKVMLVIWRPGTGGPNSKSNKAPTYGGHGYICRKKMNPPGTTYHFTYNHDDYWFNIDWWGTYDLPTAESKCAENFAKVVSIIDQAQLDEIEKQVEYRIPLTWNEVMLWTADSEQPNTNVMLVIWRPGTGGPNTKSNQASSYKGHGYVCQKKANTPGTTYHFTYDRDDYWFNIDWWGTYDLLTAESKCAEHDANVVSITDQAQLDEIEKQVEYRIPSYWNEVMLWTADSEQPNTNVMLVIWRPGIGGQNSKSNQAPSYKGHGYVCQKKATPGTVYSYDFDGSTYTFVIDWWGTYSYSSAQTACSNANGASVASAADAAVYDEMQKQIESRIPKTWNEVMIWTSDSNAPGTHVMMVIWREGTGGPNAKHDYNDSYKGHGYICVKAD